MGQGLSNPKLGLFWELVGWQHIKAWIGKLVQVDAFNLGCWGCSIKTTQGTCDYKNMGP